MQTVTSIYTGEYREKGSKFLGYLYPIVNTKDVDSNLDTIKSEHSKATHHCYAYRLNPSSIVEFANDDGEPSGTAGVPILNALRSADIINCLLVIVRYYGGTKLGKGGLISAYGECAGRTIDSSILKNVLRISRFRIIYEYPQQSLIDQLKNEFQLIELKSNYTEVVEIELGCPLALSSELENRLTSSEHILKKITKLDNTYHID